jgi:hypothetical protein
MRRATASTHASVVNPRQQCLDQAQLGRMLQRFALGSNVLREFGEHSRAQLYRVLFIERNARLPVIGSQRRQSLNDVEGPLVGRTAQTSTSTLPCLSSTTGHDGSIPTLRCCFATIATTYHEVRLSALFSIDPHLASGGANAVGEDDLLRGFRRGVPMGISLRRERSKIEAIPQGTR